MCGITGFIGKGSEKDLEKMREAIKHRGPDDSGSYFVSGVGLAHARLSVQDLNIRGRNPLWNEEKRIAIIFNGEIYNFKALKEELRSQHNAVFQTETDTEVILKLYEVFGEKSFERLDGMFAFAIYDLRTKKLILARDRIGEKPLYWGIFGQTLIFGSELKALLEHPQMTREIDKDSLISYLCRGYVPTPHSIFKGIHKLEQGSYLVYQNSEVIKHSFWKLSLETKETPLKEAKEKLDQILEETVKNRLIADVPTGVFLSGGIDSSTVAYYAQKVSNQKIKTFSIGFQEKSFDESIYAKVVAETLGTDHYHLVVSAQDSIDVVKDLAKTLDEPFADPSIVPALLLSKFARGSVIVALGGDGGDELFAGYPTFQADKLVFLYNKIPKFLRSHFIEPFIGALPSSDKNFSLSFKLQKFIEGASYPGMGRHSRWLQVFSKEELRSLLSLEFYIGTPHTDFYYDNHETSPQGILHGYIESYLMDDVLVKLDRASMHYALEVRAPFLGKELVEFTSTLPYRFKLHGFTTKYILKKVMEGRLPNSIIYRKKKGFGIPVAQWLKGELKDFCNELLSRETLERGGIFNPNYVERLKQEHFQLKHDNAKKLWALMMFQLWFNQYMK